MCQVIEQTEDIKYNMREGWTNLITIGGFQLEFVSISRVINHMTCYNLSALSGPFIPRPHFWKSVEKWF